MMGLSIIGLLFMGSTLALGVYCLLTNITFKQRQEKYTYKGDKVNNNTTKNEKEIK